MRIIFLWEVCPRKFWTWKACVSAYYLLVRSLSPHNLNMRNLCLCVLSSCEKLVPAYSWFEKPVSMRIIFLWEAVLEYSLHEKLVYMRIIFLWEACPGTPTKRRVSKRQVSKHPVSKRLKRQVYKVSGLQNVRSSKRLVAKKTSIHILYLWLVEIRRFCCSHVCRQSDGCVLFSIL